MGTTEQLVRFLVNTKYSDLPKTTEERAKELILDFARACLGGIKSPIGKIVLERIKNVGARPEASIIGGKFRTTAAYAAYVNAVLDHALELEAVGSIGPNVAQNIAAVLALGEKLKAPGWKVIESIVLGFEIQARVWNGAIVGASSRGWVLPFNHVGAVSAACKILDLDVDMARSALGISLSEASGMSCQVGNLAHYFAFAYPAYSGVEAAEYAGKGVTGNFEILEARQGFCDQFAGEGGANFDRMTNELKGASAILPPATYIKKYPCCYLSHSSIDAVLELVREHDIPYKDIKSVEVEVNKTTLSWMRYSEPTREHEARFSFEHVLGAAILDREVWLQSLSESSVLSQRYREARGKVKVIFHPEWSPGLEGFRTPVTIRLHNGKVYSKEIARPREPSREEVIRTYRELAESILKKDDIDRSIDMILTLQKLEDISQLMNILRAG